MELTKHDTEVIRRYRIDLARRGGLAARHSHHLTSEQGRKMVLARIIKRKQHQVKTAGMTLA